MRFQRLSRPTLTIAMTITGVRALLWATAAPLQAVRGGTATFDEAIAATAGIGAWLLLLWICAILTVTALTAVPGACGRGASVLGSRIGSHTSRRLARLALGLAVAAGPAVFVGGAAAAQSTSVAADCAESDVQRPDLPLIERPTRPDQPTMPVAAQTPLPTSSDEDGAQFVVSAGDTLWSIAADHLAPGASTAAVATEWPRWYEANRDAIGADPDLITPGLVLDAPTE
jgi:hypothetical protein